MKVQACFLVLVLITVTVGCASMPASTARSPASSGLNLMDLRGKVLKLDSFNLGPSGSYSGECDSKAVETGAYQNYISFGSDAAVILEDSIVCQKSPTFNMVGATPSDVDRENKMTIYFGKGAGIIPGFFSKKIPEEQKFKILHAAKDEATCSVKKSPFYKSGFGEVLCKFDANPSLWIKFQVR